MVPLFQAQSLFALGQVKEVELMVIGVLPLEDLPPLLCLVVSLFELCLEFLSVCSPPLPPPPLPRLPPPHLPHSASAG